jgi:hypothetical protein
MSTTTSSKATIRHFALNTPGFFGMLALLAVVMLLATAPYLIKPTEPTAAAKDYTAEQELALAQQRYEILKAYWLGTQRAAEVDATASDYAAAQELTLAQQRYEILRAQWPAIFTNTP